MDILLLDRRDHSAVPADDKRIRHQSAWNDLLQDGDTAGPTNLSHMRGGVTPGRREQRSHAPGMVVQRRLDHNRQLDLCERLVGRFDDQRCRQPDGLGRPGERASLSTARTTTSWLAYGTIAAISSRRSERTSVR